MNPEEIIEEELQEETESPIYGAIDAMSGIETGILRNLNTLDIINPEITLTNLQPILSEIEAAGFTSGVHIQNGILNSLDWNLDVAESMEINVLAGDAAYLLNPRQYVETCLKTPNPLMSMAYLAMNAYPFWWMQERAMVTMVNRIPPREEKVIIRAPSQAIQFGQLDKMVEVVKRLRAQGNTDTVIAFEYDNTFSNTAEYFAKITELADQGFPVGISFDTAGMTVGSDGTYYQGAAQRELERVFSEASLVSRLVMMEISSVNPSGEKHGSLEHLDNTIVGAITKWNNSPYKRYPAHFVLETDPRDLKGILDNPETLKKVLRNLKS